MSFIKQFSFYLVLSIIMISYPFGVAKMMSLYAPEVVDYNATIQSIEFWIVNVLLWFVVLVLSILFDPYEE